MGLRPSPTPSPIADGKSPPSSAAGRPELPPRVLRLKWFRKRPPQLKDHLEVVLVLVLLTAFGWFTPFRERYHAFGHVYLLAVILLSTRVGRWPVFMAAVLSAVIWNYVFIPPQLSFSVIDLEDSLILGTYFSVALIAGQLAAQVRAQARLQSEQEQRATALFHLTRALTGPATLDGALGEALSKVDELFDARASLLLPTRDDTLVVHESGRLPLNDTHLHLSAKALKSQRPLGRFTAAEAHESYLYLPLFRREVALGVLVFDFSRDAQISQQDITELLEPFGAQVTLLVEREQLRAASEREKLLAESERLHRTLFDSVSHELKTPLAVLLSASEELRKDDPVRREPLSREIRTATRRLERLVSNLLSQSRLESGVLKPHLDWCDAHDLLSAARKNVGDALASHPLTVRIPEDFPIFNADALLMEQVLANLLLNAATHTPPGTPIALSASLNASREKLCLAVEDQGPGLPSELADSLFLKFKRGDHAASGGLGLGLSIVKGFVEAQGGTVHAENLPGGGARFSVSLPFQNHENVPIE